MKYPGRPPLKPESEDLAKRMETLVLVERDLLRAILFNMKVDHPYQELIKTVKQMKGQRDLAQVAWNLVNDSLRTTCCLRYKPKMVAIAAIYLASKMINQQIQLETVPNIKVHELEEIGNEILDLYENKTCEKPKGSTMINKAPATRPSTKPPPPKPPPAGAPKPPPPKPPVKVEGSAKPPPPKPPPSTVRPGTNTEAVKVEGEDRGTKKRDIGEVSGTPDKQGDSKTGKTDES